MARRETRREARRRLSWRRMPGETADPVSVGEAAALVGAELGLASPAVFARLVETWPELVGEMLAKHSRVRAVRNDVLEVVVDSPAWATELRYLEHELLERCGARVGPGEIAAIRVVVDPGDGSHPW